MNVILAEWPDKCYLYHVHPLQRSTEIISVYSEKHMKLIIIFQTKFRVFFLETGQYNYNSIKSFIKLPSPL